uniref:Uncharacterized protein n=1 Tax=Anguilla anguilla TaxID=7936 RepID=A0A0E9UEB0_ANGAN
MFAGGCHHDSRTGMLLFRSYLRFLKNTV